MGKESRPEIRKRLREEESEDKDIDRRKFLKWLGFAVGTGAILVLGGEYSGLINIFPDKEPGQSQKEYDIGKIVDEIYNENQGTYQIKIHTKQPFGRYGDNIPEQEVGYITFGELAGQSIKQTDFNLDVDDMVKYYRKSEGLEIIKKGWQKIKGTISQDHSTTNANTNKGSGEATEYYINEGDNTARAILVAEFDWFSGNPTALYVNALAGEKTVNYYGIKEAIYDVDKYRVIEAIPIPNVTVSGVTKEGAQLDGEVLWVRKVSSS